MSSSANQRPAGTSAWADHGNAATGPVPIAGDRPLPPPPDAGPDSDARFDDDLPTTEAPAVAPKAGRAGRDLGAAIGVGLGLGAVIIASLVLWRPAFLAVLGAAVLVGVVELTQALRAGNFRAPLVPVLVGAVAMQALAWTRGPTGLVTAFLATALAVVVWRLAHGP